LQNISIQNGFLPFSIGAAVAVNAGVFTSIESEFTNNRAGSGGAISAIQAGTVTIRRSLLADNESISRSVPGGGITGANGGAVFISNDGNLLVFDSTISGNATVSEDGGIAFGSEGGGIDIGGEGVNASIVNTSISGNQANSGGGISFNIRGDDGEPSFLRIINSIISGNSALNRNTEFQIGTDPLSEDIVIVENSLFGHADVNTDEALQGDFDLSSSILATSDGGTPTTLNNILMPLSLNGGRTRTHALPPNSPAIDAATEGTIANFLFFLTFFPGSRGEDLGSPTRYLRSDQINVVMRGLVAVLVISVRMNEKRILSALS